MKRFLNGVLHCQKQTNKKILWLLDVWTRCSLLYWLVCTRPALFIWNRRLIRMDARWPSQTGSCDFRRKLKIAEEFGFWKFIGNIYCMLSTGPHTWTISTSVCVPEHVIRPAYKGLDTTELCFIVVGLLAHMYMWSPNSVVKKKKMWFWRWVVIRWKCSCR